MYFIVIQHKRNSVASAFVSVIALNYKNLENVTISSSIRKLVI